MSFLFHLLSMTFNHHNQSSTVTFASHHYLPFRPLVVKTFGDDFVIFDKSKALIISNAGKGKISANEW